MATKDQNTDIKFKSLRNCIGLLGLMLPIVIVFVAKGLEKCNCLQDSISHYYYTMAGPIFVGILCSLGLVLIFYPTPDPKSTPYSTCNWRVCKLIKPGHDGILTTISGVFAICVALCPTNSDFTSSNKCPLFYYEENLYRNGFHYFSAAIMLLIFSYMSICIFTRANDPNWKTNKWKVWRNRVYTWSGMITFISILTIAILAIMDYLKLEFTNHIPNTSTYWLEVCALVPFGISWLVKGGFILTDEGDPSLLEQATKVLPIKKN